jgi:hypothetical protein
LAPIDANLRDLHYPTKLEEKLKQVAFSITDFSPKKIPSLSSTSASPLTLACTLAPEAERMALAYARLK